MSKNHTQQSDGGSGDALTRLLRAADPAAGVELGAIARARLRKAVADAAEGAPSSAAWPAIATPWVAATAATAMLMLGAGLALLTLDGGATVPATDPAPETTPPAAAAPTNDAAAVSPPATESGAPEAEVTALTTAAPGAVSRSARTIRTMHLTAPRGTRIIWTLDPSYESPIGGRTPRQENAP